MPELPEVETIRAGIAAFVTCSSIVNVLVNPVKLRLPITGDLPLKLIQQTFSHVERRAKYLLLHTKKGALIIHLGMSGQLRILQNDHPKLKHEHVTIVFANGMSLRFVDPRRFGLVLWTDGNPHQHKILAHLGPEPLSKEFSAKQLFAATRTRNIAIKQLLMDGKVVVGVGNIYANEALFLAKVRPERPARSISLSECHELVIMIRKVLREAIAKGGTTIKDFANSEGKAGYFQQQLKVYGRGGEPCVVCDEILQETRLGQRTTVYCPGCQK